MEQIWYDDLAGFITYDNYTSILPSGVMVIEEKINAIVRFCLYLGIVLALLKSDYRYLFFGIIAAVISIPVYKYEVQQKKAAESFLETRNLDIVDNKVCSRSTVDNPFMNPSIIDISENPTHPAACSLENESVKDVVETNFNSRLFRDSGDLFDRMSSQRQFYTMPSTTIPNDQTGFAEWVYKPPRTCKEDNLECTGKLYREYGP